MDAGTASRPEDLAGMSPAAAREYIAAFISTLKLTEKKLAELGEERRKWEGRIDLARSRGAADLAAEAEGEAQKLREREAVLEGELRELRAQIDRMKGQLPGLAARERTVDPDLLEQELLIAQGRLPGEEDALKTGREFKALEKDAAADEALEALKAKMRGENA